MEGENPENPTLYLRPDAAALVGEVERGADFPISVYDFLFWELVLRVPDGGENRVIRADSLNEFP